jgi:hypothetical protein
VVVRRKAKQRDAAPTQRDDRHAKAIRKLLHSFAARGALRGLEERAVRGGKIEFRFTWLLDRRFVLLYDPARSQLELKDLLPYVPARSPLDRSIREFVSARSARSLPPHRRIDPGRIKISCVNRKSHVGFVFLVKRNQYAYAVPKLLNFCNELFGFLDMNHIQYLWSHMGVPEE